MARGRTMAGSVAVAALAGMIALSLACGGGDAPTASPTATTLAVFSTLVSETLTDEGRQWTRRVYVIDTSSGRYWRAFDYRYDDGYAWPPRILTANASIVIADGERVRRFTPDGRDETTLFEGEAIHALSVSPDGLKVALADADGILVLDVASGERLLRVNREALAALLPDAPAMTFSLDHWNAAGGAIAITATAMAIAAPHEGTGEWRTGILTLDGDLQVLPLKAPARSTGTVQVLPRNNPGHLAPDLRHAIRTHLDDATEYAVVSRFDVIDWESGRARRTVTADADTFIILLPGWRFGADRFAWFEVSRRLRSGPCFYDLTSRPRETGYVTAYPDTYICWGPENVAYGEIRRWEEGFEGESAVAGPRILDVASGAVRKPAWSEWRRMQADATRLSTRGECWPGGGEGACSLLYEGLPIWTGPELEAVGLIELAEPFTPRLPWLPD